MVKNPCKKCFVRAACTDKCKKLESHVKVFKVCLITIYVITSLLFTCILFRVCHAVTPTYGLYIFISILIVSFIYVVIDSVINNDDHLFLIIICLISIIYVLPFISLVILIANNRFEDKLDKIGDYPYRFINKES